MGSRREAGRDCDRLGGLVSPTQAQTIASSLVILPSDLGKRLLSAPRLPKPLSSTEATMAEQASEVW